MENEIKGEDIKRLLPDVKADLTNVENRYQGALRYGLADAGLLAERIGADFARCSYIRGNDCADGAVNTRGAGSPDITGSADNTRGSGRTGAARLKNTYRPSVMITHMNEYSGIDTDLLADRFGRIYLSDGRTGGDVHVRMLPQTRTRAGAAAGA